MVVGWKLIWIELVKKEIWFAGGQVPSYSQNTQLATLDWKSWSRRPTESLPYHLHIYRWGRWLTIPLRSIDAWIHLGSQAQFKQAIVRMRLWRLQWVVALHQTDVIDRYGRIQNGSRQFSLPKSKCFFLSLYKEEGYLGSVVSRGIQTAVVAFGHLADSLEVLVFRQSDTLKKKTKRRIPSPDGQSDAIEIVFNSIQPPGAPQSSEDLLERRLIVEFQRSTIRTTLLRVHKSATVFW